MVSMSGETRPKQFAMGRSLPRLLTFLLISAAYLYTFPQPNVFYAGIVLLHAVVGAITAVLLAILLFRLLRGGSIVRRLGWLLLAAGANRNVSTEHPLTDSRGR